MCPISKLLSSNKANEEGKFPSNAEEYILVLTTIEDNIKRVCLTSVNMTAEYILKELRREKCYICSTKSALEPSTQIYKLLIYTKQT